MNSHNYEIAERLCAKGWSIYEDGYPDILAERGSTLIGIEVKARNSEELRPNQLETLKMLERHGVKCYKWTSDVGFSEFHHGCPIVLQNQAHAYVFSRYSEHGRRVAQLKMEVK